MLIADIDICLFIRYECHWVTTAEICASYSQHLG